MTTIALKSNNCPAPEREADSFADSFVASFSDFCAGVRDGNEIEARYRKYSRMSKHELAELGLTRADIYRAALIGRPV